MAQFIIPIQELDRGETNFAFEIPTAWLETVLADIDVHAPSDGTSGAVKLRVYRSGTDFIVSGHARATLMVDCSRCLSGVRIEVEAEISTVMSESDKPSGSADDDLEVSGDEIGREYFEGDKLIFDDIIRDNLLLELPMQPICVDPPCPEWVKDYLITADEQAEIEAAKPADPRLKKLAGLAEKLKKN